MVGIVYYNMGNLQSVRNAFEKIGVKAEVVTEGEELKKYDRLLLPGVGAFGDAMEHLREHNLVEAIREFVQMGRPLLGICLGMQLLFEESSEFGTHRGLGLIPGKVVRFDQMQMETPHKIPHMGWNKMFFTRQTPLFAGLTNPYLYFVHSYHGVTSPDYTIGETYYGYKFTSAVNRQNIYGFQPHPEKSHRQGLKILENFSKLK
ncbi:MAG: imidazole glycerol phosphate synthase subunit HisH [Epsilonproteobacteria bacterium]|jgi:glutamine amidotransferase|nr:imidazole glycerol phosphate synthase subunit HisH [Campylobacterota bacterium]NPA89342.1 imidazole glycerol phosphate synthase subunit HisH [Campylobacterota bacterium]